MKNYTLTLLATLFVGLSFGQGLKMVARITAYAGGESVSSPMELKVNSQYVRLNEYSFEGVEQESLIFNGETSDLIILSHATKEYILLRKEEMVEMMKQIGTLKEELIAQMENMSPEERAYMEQMLLQQGVNLEDIPSTSFEKTNKKENILGYNCALYHGSVNDVKTADVWVSPFKTLGISEADLNGLILFSTYLKEIAEGFEAMSGDDDFNFLLNKEYDGIPLKEREYDQGKITSEMQVVEIEKMTFTASDFEIPSNYKSMTLEGGY